MCSNARNKQKYSGDIDQGSAPFFFWGGGHLSLPLAETVRPCMNDVINRHKQIFVNVF